MRSRDGSKMLPSAARSNNAVEVTQCTGEEWQRYFRSRASLTGAHTEAGVIHCGTSLVAADAEADPVSNVPDDGVSVARHGWADTVHATEAPPTPTTVVGVLPPFCC